MTYRILALVGEGGFGKVYQARLETPGGFHKEVAVKVLSDDVPAPELLRRFRDEARILGLVRDRAIVGVDPPIRLGQRWAVVMEFVDGESCGALLKRAPVPPGVAAEVVGEVARALHRAFHMIGPEGQPLELLHRDIKPDNVQITPSGDIRLLDFGIARANFAAREQRTQRSFSGTPGYIAPERLMAVELPLGDVFSLGVVLHELITGIRPLASPTVVIEPSGVIQVTELLQVDDASRADPHRMEVLKLAAWMRADEHEDRPSARQVEEACRKLRHALPAPYLREWAEENVGRRPDMPPDELVGQVLVPGRTPAETPARAPRTAPPPPAEVEKPGSSPLALGAVLALGGIALAALLGVGVLAAGGLWYGARMQEVAAVEAEIPAPLPDPVVAAPIAPVPAPVAAPVPEPVVAAPAPVEIRPVDRPRPAPAPAPVPAPAVVVVPVDVPAPAPAPAPAAAPVPERSGPTGAVVVRTIPSGAKVRDRGVVLAGAGGTYRLTVGSHLLELESPAGEKTRIPVSIRANDTVEICYSFDTNSACGGP